MTEFRGSLEAPGAGVVLPPSSGETWTVNCAVLTLIGRLQGSWETAGRAGVHNSNAPMSKLWPSCDGRGKPRWSAGSEVPGSAVPHAGLVSGIAIVGVNP